MKMNDWKHAGMSLSGKLLAMIVFALIWPSAMDAFPPAPHHAFQGMLRDEHGRPITSDDVNIFFETENGAVISAEAGDVFEPGINYRIKVPMDSGVTPELYETFAMKVRMPYKIHVKIGIRSYLPIEMLGSIKTIGQPGGISQLDLTLLWIKYPIIWMLMVMVCLTPGKELFLDRAERWLISSQVTIRMVMA